MNLIEFRKLNKRKEEQMSYDYSKLKGAIREKFTKQEAFAEHMGIGLSTLNLKLNNKAEWTQEEMQAAMTLLGESYSMIPTYFFTHLV